MQTPNRKINWVLLITSTLAAIVFTRFGVGGEASPRPSVDFAGLPRVVGNYKAVKDLQLDKTSLKLLTPDAYVARNYSAPNGEFIDFLLVYGRNKNTFHSPGYCMSGTGWSTVSKWVEPVPLYLNGKRQMCRFNYMKLRKHDRDMLVAWCFIERERVVNSLVWMNWYLLYDEITRRGASGALVRILAPVNGSVEQANKAVHEFAGAVVPQVVEAVSQATVSSKKE